MHVDESCNDYSRRKGAEVILIALLLAITPQSSMQDPTEKQQLFKALPIINAGESCPGV